MTSFHFPRKLLSQADVTSQLYFFSNITHPNFHPTPPCSINNWENDPLMRIPKTICDAEIERNHNGTNFIFSSLGIGQVFQALIYLNFGIFWAKVDFENFWTHFRNLDS